MYIKIAVNEGLLQKEGNVASCSPTDGHKDIRLGSVIISSVNEKAGNEGSLGASEDKVSAQDKEVQVVKNDMVMVASKQQSKACDIRATTTLPETAGNKVCVYVDLIFMTGEMTCVGLCMNECAFLFHTLRLLRW